MIKLNLNTDHTFMKKKRINRHIFFKYEERKNICICTNFIILCYLYGDILKVKDLKMYKFFEKNNVFIYSFILHTNFDKIEKNIKKNLTDLKSLSNILSNGKEYIKNIIITISEYLYLILFVMIIYQRQIIQKKRYIT
jgi:hypothetical protein